MQRTLIIGNRNYSSWSLRPWILMKQAGIAFDEIVIPLNLPDSQARIGAFSPAGHVPILVEDGLTIWDSLAIMEYLADIYPELWPKSHEAKARARSVSMEMHAGFAALRNKMPMNCRARGRQIVQTPELRRDIERIFEIWHESRREFGTYGQWLFGDFCIADAMFAPVVSRFVTYGVAVDHAAAAYIDFWNANEFMRQWNLLSSQESWKIEHEEFGV